MSNVVSLIVRLIDQIKPALPGVIDSVNKVDKAIDKATRPRPQVSVPQVPVPKMPQVAPLSDRLLPAAVAVGTAVAGISAAAASFGRAMAASQRSSAEFEDMIQGIGVTGDMAAAQLDKLRSRVLATAREVGRLPTAMGNAANELIAAGFEGDAVEKMIQPIGRVAVAARAEVAHVTDMTKALFSNMKVAPERLEAVYDKIVVATKSGNFELKDMAQSFATVAAAAAGAGMASEAAAVELAAALQIVRKGSDSSSSAATNLTNVLLKLASPETTKKFKEHGVDIRKAITEGAKKGQSPLETIVLETKKLLEKNKKLTLGDLFQDQQVQLAMVPLMRDWKEVKEIIEKSKNATGTIARDFKSMSQTLKADYDRLDAAADRRRKVFDKLTEPFQRIKLTVFTKLNDWLVRVADMFPHAAAGAAMFAVGVADIASVIGDLAPVLLGIASALAVLKFGGFGRGLAGLGRGLMAGLGFLLRGPGRMMAAIGAALLPLGRFVLTALMAGLRILTGPIGWALLAAQIAYSFRAELMSALKTVMAIDWTAVGSRLMQGVRGLWSQIKSVAGQLWNSLAEAMRAMWQSVLSVDWTDVAASVVAGMMLIGYGIARVWLSIKSIVSAAAAQIASSISNIDWSALASAALDALRAGWQRLGNIGGEIMRKLSEIDLAEAGRAIINSLLSGLTSAAGAVFTWIGNFAARVREKFNGMLGKFGGVAPGAGAGGDAGSSGGAPAPTPQNYRGDLAPAPALRQASVTFHNSFVVNGASDPDSAARQIMAALDRQRQAGLYDGALA